MVKSSWKSTSPFKLTLFVITDYSDLLSVWYNTLTWSSLRSWTRTRLSCLFLFYEISLYYGWISRLVRLQQVCEENHTSKALYWRDTYLQKELFTVIKLPSWMTQAIAVPRIFFLYKSHLPRGFCLPSCVGWKCDFFCPWSLHLC